MRGNKGQIHYGGARPSVQLQPKIQQQHFVSTIYNDPQMFGRDLCEIFPDPRREKQAFVEQYLGLFLAELGLFAILCQAFSLLRLVPSLLLSLG